MLARYNVPVRPVLMGHHPPLRWIASRKTINMPTPVRSSSPAPIMPASTSLSIFSRRTASISCEAQHELFVWRFVTSQAQAQDQDRKPANQPQYCTEGGLGSI